MRAHPDFPSAAAEVLTQAEKLREERLRIEREMAALGREIGNFPPTSQSRTAAEHAMQSSLLCALGLAQKTASLLSNAHIPAV